MYEKYIRDRIYELRTKKGVSEYKMSYDLGHSKSYIQSISSGRALPSMSEFLYICDYFGITPKEFFDESLEEPELLRQLNNSASYLHEKDLKTLIYLSERLNSNKTIDID
ncbi:MAG: helix-turn-helix transcriptional regulator [Ruminococcus sp.]|nr:helix-turn-helix transcriptional regulator [Ruminococcus sp.]